MRSPFLATSAQRCVGSKASFTLLALLVLLLGSGCADSPKKSSLHYSPTSVVPVREQIFNAQVHAKAEAAAGVAAAGAIAKAQSLVGRDSVEPENIPQLQESLGEASGQVNQLLTQNAGLQTTLAETQPRIDKLEENIAKQTTNLNTCSDQKNELIDQVSDLKAAAIIHDRKYHRLKFAVCSLITAAAVFLAIKLGALKLASKAILLGPWGIAGAAAAAIALPSAIFAFLWFKL